MITKDDVKHIADISKLKFSDEEIDVFTEKFAQVISFVETIKEVNTDNVEPTYQVNDDTQALKENGAPTLLTKEEVLQNTEEEQYGYFKILRVVE